jgi:hypothetical protein
LPNITNVCFAATSSPMRPTRTMSATGIIRSNSSRGAIAASQSRRTTLMIRPAETRLSGIRIAVAVLRLNAVGGSLVDERAGEAIWLRDPAWTLAPCANYSCRREAKQRPPHERDKQHRGRDRSP